jgi:2-polyprenyl-6-methoxyphenol hydroxylase-like FAD-dependent oxidoreductase
MSVHIVVAGGGIGGLALAQGLVKAGVSVAVYESDPAPDFRPQAYRIHIDAVGDAALESCLPADLFALYRATSTRTPTVPAAVFFDERLVEVGARDNRAQSTDPQTAPTAVDRLTLRQILLARLDDVVRFGRRLVSHEQDDDGVTARFADGSTARGDLLVSAEGIHSSVRRQLLPGVDIHDTGVRAVTGRTPLADLAERLPERMVNSFTGVHAPGFRTLALAPYQSRRPHAEAAAELAPDVRLAATPDYLMWQVAARSEDLPLSEARLWQAGPDQLLATALRVLDGWHPRLRAMVEPAEPASVFALSVRAVLPSPPWRASRVTMLGDAIHAMAPIGGRGANTAVGDAAELARQLTAVDRGESELLPAVTRYESAMRGAGYAAVADSLRNSGPTLGARSPYAPERFAGRSGRRGVPYAA